MKIFKFNELMANTTMKCKCDQCGSNDVIISVSLDDKVYDINPKKLTQNKAKTIFKELYDSIWICRGKCEDETTAYMEIDGKKISDPSDVIEYIANNGDQKIDTNVKSLKGNKKNIIKAVKNGDLEEVNEYIVSGADLDVYIENLPETNGIFGEVNWTLLQYAINKKQWDVAVAFINGGCDVNKPMKHIIRTPLMCILGNKYRDKKIFNIIDALMIHNADLSIVDENGCDAFDFADMWSKNAHKKYIIDNYPDKYEQYLYKKKKN